MQNIKLQALIFYAANNVPYYMELFKKNKIDASNIVNKNDLQKIPILTKDIVQSKYEGFLSSEYLRYPKGAEIGIYKTSGSTGKCLSVKWSKKDHIRSMFPLWVTRKKVYGINTNDKLLSFHTNIFAGSAITNHEKKVYYRNNTVLSLSNLNTNEEQIEFYYNELMDFKPKWISAQPSTLYLIADYIVLNKKTIPDSLKYIELTGEYLFDNVLSKIKEAFNVDIADMYGMVEVNGIACQNKCGKMHILEDNVIVEILDENSLPVKNGEEGEIYVTCLTNKAMPLLRYRTDDRGILLNNNCSCGCHSSVLEVKEGRISEYIKSDKGENLTSYMLAYPVGVINDNLGNPIKQFQVIQNDINDFTVNICLKESFKNWGNSIKVEYIKLIKEVSLKNAKWTFNFIDYIYPEASTGKFKFFINNSKKQGGY